jgi:hypothetical protein
MLVSRRLVRVVEVEESPVSVTFPSEVAFE